jgi:hypothetical protein
MPGRQPLAALLAVTAAIAAVGGAAAWHVRDAVIDRHAFVQRAGRALERPPVRDAINAEIADEVLARVPGGLISADRIRSLVDSMTATPAFRRVFRHAAGRLNDALFTDEGGRSATLRLDVAGVLSDVAPQLAAVIPSEVSAQLISVPIDSLPVDTRRSADLVRTLAVLLPVLALLALAGALLVARDRRRTIATAGLATIVSGALLLVLLAIAHAAVLDGVRTPAGLTRAQARDAVGAVWDLYAGGLRTIGIVAIIAGAVVAAAVLLLFRPRRRRPAPAPHPR